MTRKERGDGQTRDISARERVLQAATMLFTSKGYAATTVREIVADAGVTKPVLYYYFGSKEGIYLELLHGPFAEFEAIVGRQKDDKGDVKSRLLSLADRVFSLFLDHLDVGRLMYSIYYGPPQGAPFFDFDAYHFRLEQAISELIAEGVLKGEIREGNVREMTLVVLGAISVSMELCLCRPEASVDRKTLTNLLHLVFEGIATHPVRTLSCKREGKGNER
jgi:AcrR family transcriptional regulator